MIRTRLEELSLEALYLVATQNGLDVEPDIERDRVIDQLVDLIVENREERELANSVTVKIQQKKYALLRDDETPLTQDRVEAIELPQRYEINRITLMLRDPRWAYTYWDISSGKVREYQESQRFDGLHLRVLQLDGHSEDLRILDSFEIPVQLSDTSWYIYLPPAGVVVSHPARRTKRSSSGAAGSFERDIRAPGPPAGRSGDTRSAADGAP
jgi:hypothetical protein